MLATTNLNIRKHYLTEHYDYYTCLLSLFIHYVFIRARSTCSWYFIFSRSCLVIIVHNYSDYPAFIVGRPVSYICVRAHFPFDHEYFQIRRNRILQRFCLQLHNNKNFNKFGINNLVITLFGNHIISVAVNNDSYTYYMLRIYLFSID